MCWSWQVTMVYTCITFSYNIFENCFENCTHKNKNRVPCLLEFKILVWWRHIILDQFVKPTMLSSHNNCMPQTWDLFPHSCFSLCFFCPKSFFFLTKQRWSCVCFIMVLASQFWFFHPLVNSGLSDFTNDHHHHHHHHQQQHTMLKTHKKKH